MKFWRSRHANARKGEEGRWAAEGKGGGGGPGSIVHEAEQPQQTGLGERPVVGCTHREQHKHPEESHDLHATEQEQGGFTTCVYPDTRGVSLCGVFATLLP